MSAYRDMATDAGYTGDEAAEAARVLEEQHREESDRTCRDCDEREPMSDYGTNAQGVVSAQAGQIMALEAEVKGLREALHSEATRLHQTARDAVRYQDERNEARAEVERLREQRDKLAVAFNALYDQAINGVVCDPLGERDTRTCCTTCFDAWQSGRAVIDAASGEQA